MLIHSLQLRHFRNLESLNTDFSPGINVIHGNNAQGKTNLLESIYLLVTGRSFRAGVDSEMIPWTADEYQGTFIRAVISKKSGEEQITFFFNGKEKRVLIDGKPITRLANLIGRLNAVLFTPSDLLLVRGNPALRRRFIDIAIGQTSPSYIDALQTYQQVLKNRNVLLKHAAHRSGSEIQLDVYDQQLAESGATIVNARFTALAQISEFADKHYQTIAGKDEPLIIRYEPTVEAANFDDKSILTEALINALKKSRADDLRRLSTSRGPHRDDFDFQIQGHPARQFASQGQQRSAVLAVKLAEMDYLSAHTGESPILMLDDLMSELDDLRKNALLNHLNSGIQTFITTTDPNGITDYAEVQNLLRIHRGVLEKI